MRFADVWEEEVSSLIRDMQRPFHFVGENSNYWYDALRYLLHPPIVITQRKMCARIRITKELMDEYSNASAQGTGALSGYSPNLGQPLTLKHRLEGAVADAKTRLRDAEEARDILERNPDLEKLLNIMQKGRF